MSIYWAKSSFRTPTSYIFHAKANEYQRNYSELNTWKFFHSTEQKRLCINLLRMINRCSLFVSQCFIFHFFLNQVTIQSFPNSLSGFQYILWSFLCRCGRYAPDTDTTAHKTYPQIKTLSMELKRTNRKKNIIKHAIEFHVCNTSPVANLNVAAKCWIKTELLKRDRACVEERKMKIVSFSQMLNRNSFQYVKRITWHPFFFLFCHIVHSPCRC